MNLLIVALLFFVAPALIALVAFALGTIFADELHALRSLFAGRNPFSAEPRGRASGKARIESHNRIFHGR